MLTLFYMFLLGGASARVRVFVDLVFDLLGRVGHKNRAVGNAGAHFGPLTLQRCFKR